VNHHLCLAPLVLSVLAVTAAAQENRGDLTIAVSRDPIRLTSGSLGMCRAGAVQVTLLSTVAPLDGLTSVCTSPWSRRLLYGGQDGQLAPVRGFCDVYELTADTGVLRSQRTLTTAAIDEGFLVALCVVGNYVYVMGQQHIRRVPLAGGAAELVYSYGAGESAFGMTTDGRWLYAALGARAIYRLPTFGAPSPTLFTNMPGALFEITMALALGANDQLLVLTTEAFTSARLHELDRSTGALLRSLTLPLVSGRSLAVDPASGDIFIGGGTAAGLGQVLVVHNWSVLTPTLPAVASPPALALRRSWPLQRRGAACAAGNGVEPRIRGVGVPSSGNAGYAVGVDTRANAGAVLASGIATVNPVPFDLGPRGAPGCFIGLGAVTGTSFRTTDAQGSAAVPIPTPTASSLLGVIAEFQWLVLDPTANALGAATSQVGAAVVD